MRDPQPSAVDRSAGGDEEYAPPESLAGPVASGVKWKFTRLAIREGSRLAVGILLARLLTPAEWGLAGMALVVAALLNMVADLSIGAKLIQRSRITEADRSTLFWSSVAFGAIVAAVGVLCSGLVADFFGEPQLQPLFAVTCIGVVIASTEKVPGVLLTRDLAFRGLEIRQIIATMAGAAVAVGLALAGAGAWAIIGNSLTVMTTSTSLLWLMTEWRPRFVFSWTSFREQASFGGKAFASQLLLYAQLNVDKVLVGRFLGTAPLGNYAFGFQLMFTPILNIAFPITEILLPVLAMIQKQHERLNATWLRAKRLSVALTAPAFLLAAVLAPDLLPTLFGHQWDDAVPVLQLLCFAGVAFSLNTVNSILLIVTDNAGALFRLSLVVAATTTIAAAVGLHWGVVGVAAAYALGHWLTVLPEFWITTRCAGFPLRPALRAALSPLPFAFAAATVAYLVRLGLVGAGVGAVVRILVVTVVLVVVYAASAYAGSQPLRREGLLAFARISSLVRTKRAPTVA